MDMRYEAYSYADRLFYDSPVRWGVLEEFAAAGAEVPSGWVRQPREVWLGLQPTGQRLPDQGWKIHVSACLDNAEEVLALVSAFCVEHRVAFKFLRSPALVQTQNAKYAARSSSGKFMTLYPVDDDALERCLSELGAALEGQPGPYILSDLRWGEGPLYLRYGGFTEQYCRSEDGELVLAVREPSGRLRPDVRRAAFDLPPWAPVPGVLARTVAERATGSVTGFPYAISSALHFSNGGGIYLAEPEGGGEQVVLKEARPHAGLDQRGEDAVTRLGREHRTLRRLAGVAAVPREFGYLTAWEHHFLVQEFIAGVPLNLWFGQRYPLIHPEPDEAAVAEYRDRALTVLASVQEGLDAIHARGVVFGDLHPRNLIVRPDGRVAFIDFELASPAEDFLRPALGAAGFAAPPEITGFAVDRFALAALSLWIFFPLLPLTALDPDKAAELAQEAQKRFALPAGFAASVLAHMAVPAASGTAPRRPREAPPAAGLLSGDTADWPALRDALAAGITATATPERQDRLFPGDPGQFTHDALGLAYGAAGVLYALHTCGAPVDPVHLQWLLDAVARNPARPGLYLGSHGVAYTLDRLGQSKEALNLLDRLADAPLDRPGPELADGLAGIGLVLLHFARVTGERTLRDDALAIADRLAAGPGRPPGRKGTAGLMRGGSGTALFLLRLYESTLDTGLLDLAGQALDGDLANCLENEDGTLQVEDGSRVLPYLESGSAGIGAVLHGYLAHRPDPVRQLAQDRIRLAAEPEFIVQSGLFNGRAGLIAYLALLQDGGVRHAPVIRRHIRRLRWHLLPYQGHPAFPGDQLLRLSTDLATGSAGVLLALGTALAATPALPFWTPADGDPGIGPAATAP